MQLDRVEKFNLGFNDESGSALVWVDDFGLGLWLSQDRLSVIQGEGESWVNNLENPG